MVALKLITAIMKPKLSKHPNYSAQIIKLKKKKNDQPTKKKKKTLKT